jgi:hypothetical protein
MHVPQIAAELSRLIHLEIDAVEAYRAAIEAAGPGAIATELGYFHLEHQRHAVELCEAMLRLGYSPPSVEPQVKGCVIGALTPPRPPRGAGDVLVALRGNEQLSSSLYAKVLARNLPAGIRQLIDRGREDERRHLDWVERALSRRAWERPAMARP